MMLKDVMIYSTSSSSRYLQVLSEAQAEDLSNKIDSPKVMEMITVLLDTLKDYKSVTAINPLFEVSLLKLAGIANQPQQPKVETKREEKVVKPIVREEPAPRPEPVVEEPKAEPVKEEPKPVVEEKQRLSAA